MIPDGKMSGVIFLVEENWGMEAIDVPGAWEYRNQMQPVNVGILDLMFDVNHKDLNFVEQPLGNVAATSGEWDNHGTHVAGTIAATFDKGLELQEWLAKSKFVQECHNADLKYVEKKISIALSGNGRRLFTI